MHRIIVAAVARNNIIGDHGQMPWHIPEDLRHFRRLTMGHPVIMGRRTWESLGGRLDGRPNIVLSRNPDFDAEGAIIAHSLNDAFLRAESLGSDRVYIIGGGEVFEETIPLADEMVISELPLDAEGDTRFPSFPGEEWMEVARTVHATESGLSFDVVVLRRRSGNAGG